jgi:hypothetical protein
MVDRKRSLSSKRYANKSASCCTETSQSESTLSAERKNNASKSREPTSARLVTLRKVNRQKGFSVRATNHISKAVRQSTDIVYDAKWSIFVNWCVGVMKIGFESLLGIWFLPRKEGSVKRITADWSRLNRRQESETDRAWISLLFLPETKVNKKQHL